MSAEEAIKKLTDRPISSKNEIIVDSDFIEAIKLAIAALRSHQVPAKLDRSRWEGCPYCKDARNDHVPYCQYCGRPQTEEAWAELERRINGGTVDL